MDERDATCSRWRYVGNLTPVAGLYCRNSSNSSIIDSSRNWTLVILARETLNKFSAFHSYSG
jgi:hypothetical protein